MLDKDYYQKLLGKLNDRKTLTPRSISKIFDDLEDSIQGENASKYISRLAGIKNDYATSLEEIQVLDLAHKRERKSEVQQVTVSHLIELITEIIGMTIPRNKKVFIVHGHNPEMRLNVEKFLTKGLLEPVVLADEPSKGMTVIEKLEHYSDVAFAVVLLSPDDIGYKDGLEREKKARARQNVILELGYFMAKLGRGAVVGLYKNHARLGFEVPSDVSGVIFVEHDESGGWQRRLADELAAFGFDIDYNLLFRRRTP